MYIFIGFCKPLLKFVKDFKTFFFPLFGQQKKSRSAIFLNNILANILDINDQF